jgi:hypothetical protein
VTDERSEAEKRGLVVDGLRNKLLHIGCALIKKHLRAAVNRPLAVRRLLLYDCDAREREGERLGNLRIASLFRKPCVG